MTILITGGAGQLGQALQAELQLHPCRDQHHFLFTDRVELDITSLESLRAYTESHQIDIVVNCAAYTQVDRAEEEVEQADLINHQAVEYLATWTQEIGATLIHISTDYVFSGEASTPYGEDSPIAPLGVYGQTKRAGEEAITSQNPKHIILRTSWLYSLFASNFLRTMLRLTKERETLFVVFDQIGTPTLANDLARAILDIIATEQSHKYGIYHYSNEGVCSWYDFAVAINRYAGHHCLIKPCRTVDYPTPARRPAYSVLDKQLFRETFSLPIRHWQDALSSLFPIGI